MNTPTKDAQLIISHVFDAPVELVFQAFSEAGPLAEWWGPKGMPITVVKLDFRTGGIFHYKSEANGQVMWGRLIYGRIEKPHRIEFVSSFSDEKGGLVRAPFAENWPMEIMNFLTLTDQDGKTKMVLTGYPINATEAEINTYTSFKKNMEEGFAGTFGQLEEWLARQ